MRTGRSVRGVLLFVFAIVLILGTIGLAIGLRSMPAEAAFPDDAGSPGEGKIVLSSPEKELKIIIPKQIEEEPDEEAEEEEPERMKTERDVAEFFAEYVFEITGRNPKIIETDFAAYDFGGRADIVLNILPKEEACYGSYVLRAGKNADESLSDDKNLYIEGYGLRGLMNGVYAYLRLFCGVNVYSTEVSVVPKSSTMVVENGYYLFYKPLLEYADTDWISPHDWDFSMANGLNGTYSPADLAGGRVNYITFCHSLSTVIVPAERDYKKHPEYFALSKEGKREPSQLCLSNPEVIETAKKDVLDLIEEEYDEKACLNIISVTQDDNQNYCHCDSCNKIAETYGGQSGLMIWFVNQIADAVADSEYSDVVVDTFAYQYTRKAPVGIEPRQNVCVRLCTIECCFSHALEDPDCEHNVDFMADLKDWSKICSRLYIWDYTTNYGQTIGVFPDFGVLQKNIDTFVKYNVVGIYEEGAYYAAKCNTEFADLRSYLLARYMYDPFNAYGTTDTVLDDFLKAYYGEGWEEIGKFIAYVTAHAGDEEEHLFIGSPMEKSLHDVTDEDIVMLDAYWSDAEKKALNAGNDEAADRIKRSRICWEYYKACVRRGEYSRDNGMQWMIANQKLIDSLLEYGVTYYSEGRPIKETIPVWTLSPDQWNRKDSTASVVASYLFSSLAVVLSVVLSVLALKKKKYSLLVLPAACVLATVLSDFSNLFFTAGESPALFCVLAVAMCFCVGFFPPAFCYTLKKDKSRSQVGSVLAWSISSLAIAILFLLGVAALDLFFWVNKPEISFLDAYFGCQLIMLTGLTAAIYKI